MRICCFSYLFFAEKRIVGSVKSCAASFKAHLTRVFSPQRPGWLYLWGNYRDQLPMAENKYAMIDDLDDLVAYCKESE